jgi:hypothetical protein
MKTPTPRTDAEAQTLIDADEVVPADFARTLERELAHERERSRLLLVAMNERDDGYTESRKRMSALESALNAEREKVRALSLACERLRDCDWVISLPDRMDAVRDIARAALAATEDAK